MHVSSGVFSFCHGKWALSYERSDFMSKGSKFRSWVGKIYIHFTNTIICVCGGFKYTNLMKKSKLLNYFEASLLPVWLISKITNLKNYHYSFQGILAKFLPSNYLHHYRLKINIYKLFYMDKLFENSLKMFLIFSPMRNRVEEGIWSEELEEEE